MYRAVVSIIIITATISLFILYVCSCVYKSDKVEYLFKRMYTSNMRSSQIFSHTNHSQLKHIDIYVHGQGDQLTDRHSKRYRDLTSGLWNVNWGYNSEYYRGVYELQSSKLHYQSNCYHSSVDIVELAAREIVSYYSMGGVYFGTGGSDAIRVSMYMAKSYTGKSSIISHSLGYHGCEQSLLLSSDLVQSVDSSTAAVIVEPIMTTSGVWGYSVEELLSLDRARAQWGFLIIFDETVTGLRVDLDHIIQPDIVIVSKGLTNGLFPFSATLVSDKLMEYIQTCDQEFDYGLTMSGHPIGCALMLKSLELYQQSRAMRMELQRSIVDKLQGVVYRNHGLLFGIDVPDGALASSELKDLGYIIHNYQNTLIFVPMFIADVANYQSFFDYIQGVV